ncbi:unnamed protein product [Spirodela intermedia]|uniref:Exonuclease 1 n=1 Tax=Spirodela intermedia TaxID=51605 RepID=A0A7I8ITG4_SPIIN|nr:unnamed protein product [Spirodela intermedia]CAA6661263.1 unnamed protein product [Spirodela intermedia]
MGIPNLLRFVKPYIQPIHIKKYSGKRVGIDAYSWLHKGAYSCSMELCLNKQTEAARRYLRYFMHHINLLRHHDIKPVVVFDGGDIPSKSSTEDARSRKRHENLALAKEKLEEGNAQAAIDCFQRAVSISPEMAHQLIQVLRVENVEFVVAPYEADAQLAYLSSIDAQDGGIAAVITEDSDLMAYGCPAIIFKMDRHGNGDEIIMDEVLNSSRNGLSFQHFDKELFTGMCVLAGCDFLPSVPGIGIKRAYSLVSKYRTIDRALSVLSSEKASIMPRDYCSSFQKAIAIFHHARIYDIKSKKVEPMKPLPDALMQALHGDLDFLGPELPPSIAIAIAEGLLNPITMEPFDHLPASDIQSSSAADQDFNDSPVILEITPTKESCFTIFSAKEGRKRRRLQASLLTIVSTNSLLPQQIREDNRARRSPKNNPFKRRKLPANSGEAVSIGEEKVPALADPREVGVDQVSILTDVDLVDEIVCVTTSEVDIEAEPTGVMGVSKVEKKLSAKNKCQAMGSGRNSILRFFNRL